MVGQKGKKAFLPRWQGSLELTLLLLWLSEWPNILIIGGAPKVNHFIHNQDRPDKAFTTDRAKKTGNANACSGKIFVTVPLDHFGPITPENDPERKLGVLWRPHFPHFPGIFGQSEHGAQSVALSGGYEDDEDHGEWFLYTRSGERDLSGNKRINKKQSSETFFKFNVALRVSCRHGYPVRVVRQKRRSYPYANALYAKIFNDHPNAFWERKRHIVELPYEEDFDKRKIPTNARPCQMNYEY
ncbi:hypothetical protein ACJIZ3_023818 [Penstemon smallii]|uniref:YDG domain-containing protein n=1 Tax=Penstemon smallii TaxID=265156 RepID=A0ABD3TSF6_9LAMI